MFSPCPVVRPVLRGPARRAGESIPGVHFRANMGWQVHYTHAAAEASNTAGGL